VKPCLDPLRYEDEEPCDFERRQVNAAPCLPNLRHYPSPTRLVLGRANLRPLVELGLVWGLLEFDLWCVRSLGNAWLRVLTYSLIAGVIFTSLHRRGGTERAPAAAGRAWMFTLGVTALSAGALAIAGWLAREPYEACWQFLAHKPASATLVWALTKCVVVAAQQLALQQFLGPICRELCRRRELALALAAGLFGLIHLPSWNLVGITALAAAIWIWLFEHHGRLLPLMVSHLVLAVLAHGVLPERLHYDLRVGSEAFEHLRLRRLAYSEETRAALRVLTTEQYYQSHGGTAEGFARALYTDLLQREPADWERALWVNNLKRLSRAEAAEAMLMCAEYQDRKRLAGQAVP
jgi:CAAX prenyl protease-like protein